MANLDDMDLEKFRLWTEKSLKCFLSLRGKSTDGKFAELAARAFIAWEEKVPVNIEAEHRERVLLEEYKSKLIVGKEVLPDPMSLSNGWFNGWFNEAKGIIHWPPVYITDIASYLNCTHSHELVHQLLNEYKVGKAYRYYKCKWVKEVLYHNLRESGPFCFLKCKVKPSMSLSAPAYDVWAVVKKSIGSAPGGEIMSAYCTCTAGMHGCCNHVAGLLFKIEEAVVTGQKLKSSTDTLCQWNIPKGKQSVKPQAATSVKWGKAHFGKRQFLPKVDCGVSKSKYMPCSESQEDAMQDKKNIRKQLLAISSKCTPSARFRKLIMKEPPVEVPTCPSNLSVMVQSFATPTEDDLGVTMQKFRESLSFSAEQCTNINNATILQSRSAIWKDQRKGRITASSFYRIQSRAVTLSKDTTADPTAVIALVMGYKDIPQTEAMKHGISCEPHAKQAYGNIMKSSHKKFSMKESGIVVMADKPYISASPDLVINCDCCGKGLCEIKCPANVKALSPTVENVPFLELGESEELCLKRGQYFAQVQGQMGVLGVSYCDLYVFSFHGSLCTRVKFEESYWLSMLQTLDTFWINYILPELFTGAVKTRIEENKTKDSRACRSGAAVGTVSISATEMASVTKRKKALASKVFEKKKPVHTCVFLCPACSKPCEDDPKMKDQDSIQCTKCLMWYHIVCTGLSLSAIHTGTEDWFCSKCIS